MKRRAAKILIFFILAIFAAAAISLAAMTMRESRTAEAVAPPGRFMKTRDAQVFVMQEGSKEGQHVVLIHGTGAWSEIWRATINALAAERFNVTTVDIPPFGFSEKLKGPDSYAVEKQADRLLDALGSLGIRKAVIVCHSVGCRPAMEAALKQPDTIEKLVLVDPALGFAEDRNNPHFEQKNPGLVARIFLSAGILRDAVTAAYGTSSFSIKPLFSSFVHNKAAVDDERLAMLKRPLVIKGMTAAEGDWLENLVVSPEYGLFTDFGSYRKIGVPVFIMWGREDTITPLWQAEALTHLFQHASLSVIGDCGHIPYIESPDAFNAQLLSFLKEK